MSLRLLVVEDDPPSREFIRCTLSPFGQVDTAGSLGEAEALCARHRYGLLLLDMALPDGHGDDWLAAQRGKGVQTDAVALTAELDVERRQRLMARGFAGVLPKPLSEARLRQALAPWLGAAGATWDDPRALAALGGSQDALLRMRRLFLDELPRQRACIVAATQQADSDALRGVLHQMAAGCGFVGAHALSAAVEGLRAEPGSASAVAALLARIDEALATPP